MSHVTTPHHENEHVDPELFYGDTPEQQEANGSELGMAWALQRASYIQKLILGKVELGEGQPPDFARCGNGEEAVHELVRHLCPPCGLHCDTARAYWESMAEDSGIPPKPYVEGFYRGARAAVEELIARDALHDALLWVELEARPEELENAERFAQQHGDTWQREPPEGCHCVFDVALRMAGYPRNAPSPVSEIVAIVFDIFCRTFGLDGFAVDTKEYATAFIQYVVEQVRRRQARRAGDRQAVPDRPDRPLRAEGPCEVQGTAMNSIRQRQATLRRLDADRAAIRLPLPVVTELSQWLADEYGIVQLASNADWWSLVESAIGEEGKDELSDMVDKRNEAAAALESTARLDQEIYEFIAQGPLSGPAHSERRCLILDAAAFLTAILQATECEGPVLDVGCQVGYHAAWLARRLGVRVLGIDKSPAVINYANEKTKDNALCEFQHATAEEFSADECYDCIYAVDALGNDVDVCVNQIDSLAPSLRAGGMLILIHGDLDILLVDERFAALADRHQLGYCLMDVIGGFDGTNDATPWSWRQCAVFLKGIRRPVPHDFKRESESMWAAFAKDTAAIYADAIYACTSDAPLSERTQAFLRAKAQE